MSYCFVTLSFPPSLPPLSIYHRFFTKKQVTGLLTHGDSPYIRAIGFLYLRFVLDPKEIWEWFCPYLDDPEEFTPSSFPPSLPL